MRGYVALLRQFEFPIRLSAPGSGPTGDRRGFARLLPVAMLVPVAMVLLFLAHNVRHLRESATRIVVLEQAVVALGRGQSARLGRVELAQIDVSDAAEIDHVDIRRRADGEIELRNIARTRRLIVDQPDGTRFRSGRFPLAAGNLIEIGAARLRIAAVGRDRIEMVLADRDPRGADRSRRIVVLLGAAGETVTIDGNPVRVCQPLGWRGSLAASVGNVFTSTGREENSVLWLGGRLSCTVDTENHVDLAGAPFRAFRIVTSGGRFYFAAGNATHGRLPALRLIDGTRTYEGFSDLPIPLGAQTGQQPPARAIIGRTEYEMRLVGGPKDAQRSVVLVPISKVHRWRLVADALPADLGEPRAPVVRRISMPTLPMEETAGRQGAELSAGERWVRWAALGAFFLLVPLSSIAARGGRALPGDRRNVAFLRPTLLMLVVVALALAPEATRWFFGRELTIVPAMGFTIVNLGLASIIMVFAGRLGLGGMAAWTAMLGLAAFGALTLQSLAIDGETTHWTQHWTKNKFLFLDLLAPGAAMVALVRAEALVSTMRVVFAGSGLWVLGARAVMFLILVWFFAAWVLFGSETGIYGFQPVEAGKLIVLIVLAMFLVALTQLRSKRLDKWYWISLILLFVSMISFFSVLFSVPYLKSDFSPIIIIVLLGAAICALFLVPNFGDLLVSAWVQIARRRETPTHIRFRKRLPAPRGMYLAITLLFGISLGLFGLLQINQIANWLVVGETRLPDSRIDAVARLQAARSGSFRVPAERMLTWYDLDHHAPPEVVDGEDVPQVLHRDLGFQLLASKKAFAHMQCGMARLTLPPQWPGVLTSAGALVRAAATDCPADAPAPAALPEIGGKDVPFSVRQLVRIPVIQNDFIGTYFGVRFGMSALLALIAFQVMLVVSAFLIAFGLLVGDHRDGMAEMLTRRALSLCAVGVSLLFAMQWGIAFGNALGLLPVMGQPMTWIAAATSHHLFLALPGALLLIAAARRAAFHQPPLDRDPPMPRRAWLPR